MLMTAIAPMNNSVGKYDATGAFQPRANDFMRINGQSTTPFLFENSGSASSTRNEIFEHIESFSWCLDVFAYFGHGIRNKLTTGQIRLADIPRLAQALGTNRRIIILLYACSSGTPNGFAQQLSLSMPNAIVYGHSTVGHATSNPYMYVYGSGAGRMVISRNELYEIEAVISSNSRRNISSVESEEASDLVTVNIWREWCKLLRSTPFWAQFYSYNSGGLESSVNHALKEHIAHQSV